MPPLADFIAGAQIALIVVYMSVAVTYFIPSMVYRAGYKQSVALISPIWPILYIDRVRQEFRCGESESFCGVNDA